MLANETSIDITTVVLLLSSLKVILFYSMSNVAPLQTFSAISPGKHFCHLASQISHAALTAPLAAASARSEPPASL